MIYIFLYLMDEKLLNCSFYVCTCVRVIKLF